MAAPVSSTVELVYGPLREGGHGSQKGEAMIEIIAGWNLERAILLLRQKFDPIRRELKDKEHHLTRSQRRRLKDIRASSRFKKKMRRLERSER